MTYPPLPEPVPKSNPASFETCLLGSILCTVRLCHKAGVTGMTIENLRAITITPDAFLCGAPRGTLARWSYRELFTSICNNTPEIASFILHEP